MSWARPLARSWACCGRWFCPSLLWLGLCYGVFAPHLATAQNNDNNKKPIPESLEDHPDVPQDHRGYSDRWTGAFVGLEAFGGASWLTTSGLGADAAWTTGVRLRANQVMSLVDLQLEYRFTRHDTTANENPVVLNRHGISAGFGAHPLFLVNLGNGWFWYALASIYVQLGISLDMTESDAAQTQSPQTQSPQTQTPGDNPEVGFGYFVGGGFDVPLTSADGPWSLWLGAHYRHHRVTVDLQPFDTRTLTEHMVSGSLSFRWSGLVF